MDFVDIVLGKMLEEGIDIESLTEEEAKRKIGEFSEQIV